MIGRVAFAKVADGFLDAAQRGQGGSLTFSGEAGIGKTTLLRSIGDSARARGFDVRFCTGTPSEADIASATLLTLLLPDLPGGLDPVLTSALGLAVADTSLAVAAFHVASAFTAHLTERAFRGPLLLIVDDIQWVDPSSALVLSLAARRLDSIPVVIAFGRRIDPSASGGEDVLAPVASPDLADILEMELGPMSHAESLDVLRSLGVSEEQSASIAKRAYGSPLALKEFARRAGSGHVTDVINVPTMFGERVAALSSDALFVCSVVALDEDFGVTRALAKMQGIELDDVVSPGLFEMAGDRIRFSHPLLRAAVLRSQSAGDRRARHRQIASVLDADRDADRFALHCAAGVVGTDDEIAELMVGVASRAKSRGALLETSRALLRAAELSSDRNDRMRRMLDAAENRYYFGEPVPAIEIARTAKAMSTNEALTADADLLIATAAEWEFDLNETSRELVRLGELLASDQPAKAIGAFGQASAMAFLAGSIPNGILYGERSLALSVLAQDTVGEFVGRAHVGWNLFLGGETTRAREHLDAVEPLMAILSATEDSVDALLVTQRLSMQHVIEERWDLAEELLGSRILQARRMGVRLSATMLSMVRGGMYWRTGRWPEAYALATDDLYSTTLPAVSKVWGSAAAAQITAALGRDDETARLVDIAIDGGTRFSAPLALAWAYTARGHLDLSHERFHAALVSFDRVVSITQAMGLRESGFFLWHGDWIETLIRLQRFDEAAAAIDQLREISVDTDRSWARGIVARTSAQLMVANGVGHADRKVLSYFAEARNIFSENQMVFERARTLLCEGSCGIQVAGDATRARESLQIFRSLGADVWAERVESLLTKSEGYGVFDCLSPAERRVATAVAQGASNRQCALDLQMNSRTVEFHLHSIYKKLGVTRRSEFAALAAVKNS